MLVERNAGNEVMMHSYCVRGHTFKLISAPPPPSARPAAPSQSPPPHHDLTDCGWTLESVTGKIIPICSTQPPWPQQFTKTLSCRCKKDCSRNCSCNKRSIPCYIGCRCQGSMSKCSRAQCNAALVNSSDSDSD